MEVQSDNIVVLNLDVMIRGLSLLAVEVAAIAARIVQNHMFYR
jgi:hypothetical protein